MAEELMVVLVPNAESGIRFYPLSGWWLKGAPRPFLNIADTLPILTHDGRHPFEDTYKKLKTVFDRKKYLYLLLKRSPHWGYPVVCVELVRATVSSTTSGSANWNAAITECRVCTRPNSVDFLLTPESLANHQARSALFNWVEVNYRQQP